MESRTEASHRAFWKMVEYIAQVMAASPRGFIGDDRQLIADAQAGKLTALGIGERKRIMALYEVAYRLRPRAFVQGSEIKH